MDNLRGYAATPSGQPPPSVQLHPGKGQCALCGRWFWRSINDTRRKAACQRNMQKGWCEKNDATYKDGHDGLRGPLPPVRHGVLSPERRCRRQMILGWPSGHGAARCGHFVNGGLSSECHVSQSVGGQLGKSGGYALEDSASSSRDLMLSRRGLDFTGAE
jgi:hypothetical protein